MEFSKYFSNSIYVVIAGLGLSGAHYVAGLEDRPAVFVTKQQSSLNIQDNFWQYFSLGQKRLASSLLWIATILESDHDHYKNRDLNSWMFLRFNTISLLEPDFYENYAFGGVYLSIVKDDLPGASIIYDKGIKKYPDSYPLLRDAGFHYYFEVGDYEKAYPIYKKLTTFNNASPLIISAMARMEADNGNGEDAFHILKNRYDETADKESIIAVKIYSNMYAIKAEKDLNCLNTKTAVKSDCDTKDLNGNPYLHDNGTYKAQLSWTPFRVKRHKKGPQ